MKKSITGLKYIILATIIVCVSDAKAAEDGIDTGATAWMLTSTALVLLMVPGLGMFYGGLVRTKNVIGTMMHSFVAMSIIGVIWAVFGYAMCFGDSYGWCGWNWDFFMLKGIDTTVDKTNGIPDLVFAMFQGKFAIITPAIIVDKTLGLKLDESAEMAGMDHSLHSEHGYGLLNLN